MKTKVLVLVGFLGSGKTTLINNLLSNTKGVKIACIVNDFSKVNIDSRLLLKATEDIVELSNGCICCTLRGDLLEAITKITERESKVDYIVVESTGIGEPLPIAQTFYMGNLKDIVTLDNIVTVVDVSTFWKNYNNPDFSSLIIDQVEFSNLLVLNKMDLVDEKEIEKIKNLCLKLNPKAKVIITKNGEVDSKELLNTNNFSYEDGLNAPAWDQEWEKKGSEADEYGFNNIVYSNKEALDRDVFISLINQWPDNVFRAKGYVNWGNGSGAFVSFAGTRLDIQDFKIREDYIDLFENKIVLIGLNLKEDEIIKFIDQAKKQ